MGIVFLGYEVCFLGHIVSGFLVVVFLGRVLRLGHDVSLLGHENRRLGHIVSRLQHGQWSGHVLVA